MITDSASTDINFDDDIALRLKRLTVNQLASIGIVRLVNGKSDEIICPHCGNGSGDSRTGLKPLDFTDYTKFHCFKCGQNFDNLDLFAMHFNLDISRDFKEILRRADILSQNISAIEPKPKEISTKESVKNSNEISPDELTLIQADIAESQKHLDELLIEDRRGLKLETLKHFNVGYLRYFIHPKSKVEGKKSSPSPRMIIPTSDSSYNAILVNSARTPANRKYKSMSAGKKQIFNSAAIVPDEIVIVVEGEIDAMSIWQAMDGKVNVCALGGAGQSNLTKFFRAINPAEYLNYKILILFDNDETGKTNSAKLVADLVKLGVPAVAKFLVDEKSKTDANDILREMKGDVLKEIIDEILTAAQVELEKALNEENADIVEDELERLKALPPSKERDEQLIKAINDRLYLTPQRKRAHMQWIADSLQENADLIFENDPNLDGLVGYDEFYRQYTFLKPVNWCKGDCTGEQWTDADDKELYYYLRRTYQNFKGAELIDSNLTHYSRKKSFHPVKQYLESLHWDKTPRAETFFSKFLNIDDTPYTREITLKWLLGAVSRIYHEGCDFQFALVLQGKQGIGKGYCLRMLGKKWYVALMDALDDSHALDTIQRGWIIEIAELAAGRKAELNAQKAFLSNNADTRRRAWGRYAETTPRHCVFAITVNDEHFLKDLTGNRRYKILESHSAQNEIVEGLTDDYVDQIWAEVFHMYQELFKDGFNDQLLRLSREVDIQAEEIADKHILDDGLQGEVEAFLEKPILPDFIWERLTKEERRKFIVDGHIIFPDYELNSRIRGQIKSPKRAQELIKQIDDWIRDRDNLVRRDEIKTNNGISFVQLTFYGTVQRESTCAAEIFNECFGNDKRKSTSRINETLTHLKNWKRDERQAKNFAGAYGNQKNQYRRDFSATPSDS